MIDRLAGLEAEFATLEQQLADPAVLGDPARLRTVGRRYKEITPVVAVYRAYRSAHDDATAAKELLEDATGTDREQLRAELDGAASAMERLEAELKELLLPKDPDDGKDVIVEIRGAEGGEEANLFARDLFEMYQALALRRGWKVEVYSADPSDLGGLNQVTLKVRGEDAWSDLKFEGGPHRVQRVPITESQGRVHTSAATVSVLPEAEEVDVEIDPNDLHIDVYRSSGPGGQGVNTTDSAVRITHKPSGIVVAMQDERSQLQNRARAMEVLRARLLRLRQEEQALAVGDARRAQVQGGNRSEKIRTYNFKENRLTDHRIGYTVYRLQDVLAGDLDELIDALQTDERTRLLAGADA